MTFCDDLKSSQKSFKKKNRRKRVKVTEKFATTLFGPKNLLVTKFDCRKNFIAKMLICSSIFFRQQQKDAKT